MHSLSLNQDYNYIYFHICEHSNVITYCLFAAHEFLHLHTTQTTIIIENNSKQQKGRNSSRKHMWLQHSEPVNACNQQQTDEVTPTLDRNWCYCCCYCICIAITHTTTPAFCIVCMLCLLRSRAIKLCLPLLTLGKRHEYLAYIALVPGNLTVLLCFYFLLSFCLSFLQLKFIYIFQRLQILLYFSLFFYYIFFVFVSSYASWHWQNLCKFLLVACHSGLRVRKSDFIKRK